MGLITLGFLMETIIALALDHWIITGWIITAAIFLSCQNEGFIDWVLKYKHDTFFNIYTAVATGLAIFLFFASAISIIKNLWSIL